MKGQMVKRREKSGGWGERDAIRVFFIRHVCGDMCDYNRLSSGCYGEHSPTDMTQNTPMRKIEIGSKADVNT